MWCVPEGCLYLAASFAMTPLEDSSPSLVHVCTRVYTCMYIRQGRQTYWNDDAIGSRLISSSDPFLPLGHIQPVTHHAVGRRELDLELPLVAEVIVEQVCTRDINRSAWEGEHTQQAAVEAGLNPTHARHRKPGSSPAVDRPKSLKNILLPPAAAVCVLGRAPCV